MCSIRQSESHKKNHDIQMARLGVSSHPITEESHQSSTPRLNEINDKFLNIYIFLCLS